MDGEIDKPPLIPPYQGGDSVHHPHLGEHLPPPPDKGGLGGVETIGFQKTEVSYWNLFTLGVTGGILPCPGALFVMMMALTSGQVLIGLYLITIFSLGLATALMTVGIVMVRSRSFLHQVSPNSRLAQLLPVLSSLVIIVVGSGFLLSGLMKYGIVEIRF
jgi:ABC-type nickel/cobalt efflux system permease component RcnA